MNNILLNFPIEESSLTEINEPKLEKQNSNDIYDYLFKFPDETVAKNTLTEWVNLDGGWIVARTFSGILPISIISQTDEPIEGFWLVISLNYQDSEMYNIPYCVQETLRPTSPTNFINTVVNTKLDIENYNNFKNISPMFAGAEYLFSINNN